MVAVCLGRARLAVLLRLRCLACRLAVCRGLFPRAVPLVALRWVRRAPGVPVVLWVARLFVAVCVGNARLFWLLAVIGCARFCVGAFVCEGVC